jgi:hypothetical protein
MTRYRFKEVFMKVLLFSALKNGLAGRVLSILNRMASLDQIEIYRDVNNLMRRLSLNPSDVSILLLVIQNKQGLSDLLQVRNHIIGHRVIMVLPDQESETLSKAHLLYPRYLTYMDSDFEDLNAVLDKMIHYIVINSKIKDVLMNQSQSPPGYELLIPERY